MEVTLTDRFNDRDRILLDRLLDDYAQRYAGWEITGRAGDLH